MNERIKDFAQQVGLISSFNAAPNRPDIEKFAELIVAECMTICEDVTERNDPAIACYYAIKQHFGVER